MNYKVQTFYDQATFTLTYVVYDENSKDAVIIDPVLDYDPASSSISKRSMNLLTEFVSKENLNIRGILETHAHADHLTSAAELKDIYPQAKVGIGSDITKVQEVFKDIYNLKDFKSDGSQFDLLLGDGEVTELGTVVVKTISTPGHTPACVTYQIDDMLFTGDALFMPDFGTGRCDFPAGSARDLYHSIQKIYAYPDETKVYVGHDYQPGGRELKYLTTVGESKKENIQLKEETSEAEYVSFRTERDKLLITPRLLLPSIQVNIDGGNLPMAEDNGSRYLKLPLTIKEE